MNRLPIRWKLTLAFALALTIVLTAVGIFLHFQLSTDVDRRHRARSPHARRPAQWTTHARADIGVAHAQLLNSWNRTKRSRRSSRRQAVWWLPRRTPTSGC